MRVTGGQMHGSLPVFPFHSARKVICCCGFLHFSFYRQLKFPFPSNIYEEYTSRPLTTGPFFLLTLFSIVSYGWASALRLLICHAFLFSSAARGLSRESTHQSWKALMTPPPPPLSLFLGKFVFRVCETLPSSHMDDSTALSFFLSV